jgi:hypothetical protein
LQQVAPIISQHEYKAIFKLLIVLVIIAWNERKLTNFAGFFFCFGCMTQSVSFIIFVHPIFLLVEKFARVHHRSMLLRILVRIPVVVLVWFVALAIPFFGPINSVMGAFLLTVVVYMLPLATFMYAYRTKAARQVLLFFILMILFYWVSFCIHQIYIYMIIIIKALFSLCKIILIPLMRV